MRSDNYLSKVRAQYEDYPFPQVNANDDKKTPIYYPARYSRQN